MGWYNIKMDLSEIRAEYVEWIQLSQDSNKMVGHTEASARFPFL